MGIGLKDPLRNAWRFVKTLRAEFTEDNGSLVAGAMSFYALLSIFPLLIVAVAALGYVLGSPDEAYRKVFDYVDQFSPALAREQGQGIRDLLEQVVRARGTAGGLGLLALLWAGSQFFVSLEKAVNIAWDVSERRGFLRQRLVAATMVVLCGCLLLMNLGLTALAQVARAVQSHVLGGDLSSIAWFWGLAGVLLPFGITIITFAMIYKLFPNRSVRINSALTGGVVAGALWEVAKQAFSWYAPRFANYSAVYGSLAGVILLAVWIYYSSIVTVIGAEVAALAANVKQRR